MASGYALTHAGHVVKYRVVSAAVGVMHERHVKLHPVYFIIN